MTVTINYITYLIILFFIISVLGWCMEVFLKYRQFHRFINRGFLIGPYLPIYGSGVVFITLTCDIVSKYDNSYGSIFLASFIICGMWEYAVSFVMEKRFHARWWDYSQKPMNLNGRVWIGNLILFGLGGLIVEAFVSPLFERLIGTIPLNTQIIMSVLIFVGMSTDYGFSHFIMKFIKVGIESSEADNTEDISKEIRFLIKDKSALYARFVEAYPNVVYRTDKIKNRLESVKNTTERMKQEVEKHRDEAVDRIKEIENTLSEKINPVDKVAKTKPGNLFDYMKWRGNITFDMDGFNEIDNLILSQLSYVDLHKIVQGRSAAEGIRLSEASELFFQQNDVKEISQKLSSTKNAMFVLREMAKTERFKNLLLYSYIKDISEAEQSQFAAVSIDLGNGLTYVSFSGTDDTIVGWREDFNMAYIAKVPGQIKATGYVEKLMSSSEAKFILGGHSKGGNLAIAAAMYLEKDMQDRILCIYNNDGPGFSMEKIQSEEYKAVLPKIRSFSPESSIVGKLFEHGEMCANIKSSNIGLLQHDALSWLVMGDRFVTAESASKTVEKLQKNLSEWLGQLDIEQKKLFVDSLFNVFEKAHIKTVDDFRTEKLLYLPRIILIDNDLPLEDRKKLSEILRLLVN